MRILGWIVFILLATACAGYWFYGQTKLAETQARLEQQQDTVKQARDLTAKREKELLAEAARQAEAAAVSVEQTAPVAERTADELKEDLARAQERRTQLKLQADQLEAYLPNVDGFIADIADAKRQIDELKQP